MLKTLILSILLIFLVGAVRGDDPYETYVKTSKDFQSVKQEKDWALRAFPSWTYMPWTYQWTIGYTADSGKWAVAHGYNGAFVDHGDISINGLPSGRRDWIDAHHLRFYNDHTAGKGDLHLWDGNDMKPHLDELHGAGLRTRPVNEAMRTKLQEKMRGAIKNVKPSPWRAAYALDDEISWGHFIHPTMWRVTDDPEAYPRWLREIYGPGAPERKEWITYDAIRGKLREWRVADFDASPLLDQWTFNDSYWNNFLGDLVEYANTLDPATPCGYVGGQAPNAFGGYDYAKLMRKVQFLEAYNLASAQAIARSFNPGGALPLVTTHFHRAAADDIWQTWYYLTHGNRGFIGWVQGWFDGKTPKPWHEEVAPTYREAAEKIGPRLAGATWRHDGVALYYSHASIQLGWILDAESFGKTWVNRNGDGKLGASHLVRHAWENMLRDEGLQYSFINYADVIQHGVAPEYKVLILPACLCLSDAEARQIEAFCRAGGTVIADYLPGLWDQHGKGRAGGGALDAMFGVHHDAGMKPAELFGGKWWCEVDQNLNFSWKTYQEFMTNGNTCLKDASGFDKAVRGMEVVKVNRVGKGTAVLMNLSPQWYNAYRVAGFEAARQREVFMKPVREGGVKRWVELKGAGAPEHGYEITYFEKEGRTFVALVLNPEITVSSTGGGNSVGLKTETIPVTLRFAGAVKDVRDERTGKEMGEGDEFKFKWVMNQAIVVSFAGAPPRG